MSADDWEVAMQATKSRSQEYPLFERRAMKVLLLLDEEEEADFMLYVNGFVDQHVNTNLNPKDVTAYMRNRLMTYIVSKLGKCSKITFLPTTIYLLRAPIRHSVAQCKLNVLI